MINKKVVLFGHFGENNLGDTILLINSLKILRGLKIIVFSGNPTNTKNNILQNNIDPKNIQIIYSGRWGLLDSSKKGLSKISWFFESLKGIFSCDLFLVGPGTILQDKTNRHFILFWFSRIIIAKMLCKKFGFFGIGIGNISSWISKKIVRYIGKSVAFTITRDKTSKDVLITDFYFKPLTTYQLIDLGVMENENIHTNYEAQQEIKRIGINFRNLEKKHFLGDEKSKNNYIKSVVGFTKYLKTNFSNVDITFFSMCSEGSQSDLLLYEIINEEFLKNNLGKIYLVESNQNISCFENEMQKMDLFVGTRLHSVILSTSLSIPTLVIAYSEKVDYYMKEIDYTNLSMPVNNISASKLINKLEYLVKNRNAISTKLTIKNVELKKKVSMYRKILEKAL